jgi:small subunit ribosomal protein S6
LRTYDLVYIVRPDIDSEALTAVVERVTQRLGEAQATIQHTEVWGKRRLTYPIRRYREGQFIFIRFFAAGEAVFEIKRMLRISEDVLRALVTQAVGTIAPPKAVQPPTPPPSAPVGAPAESGTPAAPGID